MLAEPAGCLWCSCPPRSRGSLSTTSALALISGFIQTNTLLCCDGNEPFLSLPCPGANPTNPYQTSSSRLAFPLSNQPPLLLVVAATKHTQPIQTDQNHVNQMGTSTAPPPGKHLRTRGALCQKDRKVLWSFCDSGRNDVEVTASRHDVFTVFFCSVLFLSSFCPLSVLSVSLLSLLSPLCPVLSVLS
jgi:hypothetical protein